MDEYTATNTNYAVGAHPLLHKAFERIQAHWAEHGEEFGEEEAEQVQAGDVPGEHVPFPIFMFMCALFQDALDVFSPTIIGWILLLPIKILLWLIFLVWFFGKMKGRMWKKKTLRMLLGLVIDAIPVINIIPTMTVLVLMAHYREKKIVLLMNEALEIIHQHKMPRPPHSRGAFELQS